MNGLFASILSVIMLFNGGSIAALNAEQDSDDYSSANSNYAIDVCPNDNPQCNYTDNNYNGICDNYSNNAFNHNVDKHGQRKCINESNNDACDYYDEDFCHHMHGYGCGKRNNRQ